jgi:hypothetical protein
MFGKTFRVLLSFVAFALFSSTVNAGSVSLLENTRFVRGKGKPKVETVGFSYQTGEEFELTLYNGGVDNQYCRISSAVIQLNGNSVFSPSDFSQQVYKLTAAIEPLSDNTLSVELRSKPGCGIELNVSGEAVNPPLAITSTPGTQALTSQPYQYTLSH